MNSVWLASAMASILDRGAVGPFDRDDPAAAVLASYGFLEPRELGLVAVPAFAEAVHGREAPFADAIRSTLGQAAAVAFAGGEVRGWGAVSDEILTAQARSSAIM